MAKTKSRKAPGKLSKALRVFNPRSFRGGMALFALVFAITGGGYMAYKSFAATTANVSNDYKTEKATDGYAGPTSCVGLYGYMKGPYGNFEPCLQYKGNDMARTGFFLYSTKLFYPKSGWYKYAPQRMGAAMYCGSEENPFGPIGPTLLKSAYGDLVYGYAYDRATSKSKLGFYSPITGKCSLEDPWWPTVGLRL